MFKLRSFTRLKIGSWSPTANPQHTDDQLAANHLSQNQSPPPSPPLSSITPTAPPCRVIFPSRSGQPVAFGQSILDTFFRVQIFKDVWKLVWILFLLLDANILRYLKKKKLWYICFCFSHSKYFVEENIHIHLYYLHLFQTFTQAAAVSMFEFWRPMISQFFSIHPQGGMAWEFPRGATLENLIFSPKQADCPRDCSGYKVDEYFHVTLHKIAGRNLEFTELSPKISCF